MRYIQLGVPERQNIQAAYPLCHHFGITDVQFWRGLETFRKPKHRIEFVGEWNGISFYDDSKATNIDSVMHAVGLFDAPIVLLAGGVHKGCVLPSLDCSLSGKSGADCGFWTGVIDDRRGSVRRTSRRARGNTRTSGSRWQ